MSFIDNDQIELVSAPSLQEIDSYFFSKKINRQFLAKDLYPRINSGVFHNNNPAEDLFKTHITFEAELVLMLRRIPDDLIKNVDANL